jgi:hypothetical protein
MVRGDLLLFRTFIVTQDQTRGYHRPSGPTLSWLLGHDEWRIRLSDDQNKSSKERTME